MRRFELLCVVGTLVAVDSLGAGTLAAQDQASMGQALYGETVTAEWLYPTFGDTLESHDVAVDSAIELPPEDILNDSNFSIDIGDSSVRFEFIDPGSWSQVAFNGWRFTDKHGTIPAIVNYRIGSVSNGVTGLDPGDLGWTTESAWADFAGVQIDGPGEFIVLELDFGVFFDDFESGDTSAWSATVPPPSTCVIAFDDAWATNGHGSDPDTFYAPSGVHFDNLNGYGCIGGVGNGDPGNWSIEGTNGSAAWGLWADVHAIHFDQPVTTVSLDLLRGHNDYSITLDAYLGGAQVDTQTLNLVGAFDAETASFDGPLDEIRWDAICCYGMDNIVYTGFLSCP